MSVVRGAWEVRRLARLTGQARRLRMGGLARARGRPRHAGGRRPRAGRVGHGGGGHPAGRAHAGPGGARRRARRSPAAGTPPRSCSADGGRPPVIGEGKITWPDGTIDDVPEPETATFPGLSK
ncbi:hypothetical protein [Nonomuraea rubra]|uniref:hypothetical protein n=1 Tax=Nonomuraea rubra TaxID=46180 RepID=UPI0031EB127D